MTLLSICQNAADNTGTSSITSIVGNQQPAARRLMQAARRTGRSLADQVNWVALVTENVFISNGSTLYNLPVDFRSIINDTIWDRSKHWKLRGAMSPQQWQSYKSSLIGPATVERRWRMRIPSGAIAGSPAEFNIDLDDVTGGTTSYVYEYVSKNWVRSGVLKSASQVVNVVVLTDNVGNVLTDGAGNVLTAGPAVLGGGTGYLLGDIIGLAGGTFTQAAELMVTGVGAGGSVTAVTIVPIGGTYSQIPVNPVHQGFTNGAGTGAVFNIVWAPTMQDDWLNDSDTSILSEDLIELGVVWRLLARLGMSYAEEKAEYDAQVGQAIARDGGAATLSLAPYNQWALIGADMIQGNFPGR
jgi:hypothetical protein